MLIVVKRLHDMHLDPQVLSRMATLAPAHTLLCLAVLEQWLENEPDQWALRHAREHLRPIVEAGSTAGDEAAALARKIASALAIRGVHLSDG